MTDSEKVALIDKMISDFWEFSTEEKLKEGSETMVEAIYSVVNFGGDDNGKT